MPVGKRRLHDPHDGNDDTCGCERCRHVLAAAQRTSASNAEVDGQDDKGGERDDDLGCSRLEEVEVHQSGPPLTSGAISGELKPDLIRFKRMGGYRPTTTVATINTTAPMRSGMEMAESGAVLDRKSVV